MPVVGGNEARKRGNSVVKNIELDKLHYHKWTQKQENTNILISTVIESRKTKNAVVKGPTFSCFSSSLYYSKIKSNHHLLGHMLSLLGAAVLKHVEVTLETFFSVRTHTHSHRFTKHIPMSIISVWLCWVRCIFTFRLVETICRPHYSKWMASIALRLCTAVLPERPSLDSTQ